MQLALAGIPGLTNCHSVQIPAHPFSTLTDAATASSGTCHCYPEWHNFPVYASIMIISNNNTK